MRRSPGSQPPRLGSGLSGRRRRRLPPLRPSPTSSLLSSSPLAVTGCCWSSRRRHCSCRTVISGELLRRIRPLRRFVSTSWIRSHDRFRESFVVYAPIGEPSKVYVRVKAATQYGKDNFTVTMELQHIREFVQKCRYIFITICTDENWHLMCIDMHEEKFLHYNSLSITSGRRKAFQKLTFFLKKSLPDIFPASRLAWKITEMKNIPMQHGTDCVIIILMYMDYLQSSRQLIWDPIEAKRYRGNVAAKLLLDKNSRLDALSNL